MYIGLRKRGCTLELTTALCIETQQ
ncbi:hypothetical protein NC653_026659 [Populus alba x Populus x berolinensis]|uniref:Uncharacterized protein n=1 Tax=Populus alba x Populus x berolinensis TaxID=444605 RepID=A0AAD6Q9F1_9ROSI|nr:hypothetical protein NC653_026659 [Populus alba x Populus x berolinensis]